MAIGIAIFASGGGSNAQKIIEHFADSDSARVELIVSNKPDAYVLQRASNHNIPTAIITKQDLTDEASMLNLLQEHNVDLIVLAGFLLLIPTYLVKNFPRKIINIHPALLPKYGGKGMYGSRVHQAVFDNNERESGITIHYVDENYDEGKVIFQEKVALEVTDTPDLIAQKVLALEHKHYPSIIEEVIRDIT